jgi:hypothetical protein
MIREWCNTVCIPFWGNDGLRPKKEVVIGGGKRRCGNSISNSSLFPISSYDVVFPFPPCMFLTRGREQEGLECQDEERECWQRNFANHGKTFEFASLLVVQLLKFVISGFAKLVLDMTKGRKESDLVKQEILSLRNSRGEVIT